MSKIVKHYGHRMDQRWRAVQRTTAWTEQDSRCKYCRCALTRRDVTSDHVLPRSKGGIDRGNIVACCVHCNRTRLAMPADKFKRMVRAPGFPRNELTWQRQWNVNLARVRYRLNRRADLAVKRINRLVGIAA